MMKLIILLALFSMNVSAEKVQGGIDPDIIRKVLIEHVPQFRYCLQKELDKSEKPIEFQPMFRFIIGKKGTVTKYKIDNGKGEQSKAQKKVIKCVGSVLKGIKFPEPVGGGVVEVNQPMNFYPRKK